jgi:2-amino-4-hydroxy-6-hydroxymethyldihydropteridine diphosphokinase
MTTTSAQERHTVLSLGSNLGDRLDNLQEAVDALFDAPGLDFIGLSPVYETKPVGGPEQGDFLNVVIVANSQVAPESLLERVLAIEESMDRTREVRWGPRTLDIDIVMMGDVTSDDPDLLLPHPRARERAFVLRPWCDLDPDAALPGQGRVTDLLPAVAGQELRRRDDLSLQPPA